MSTLTGTIIANTYKQLLQVGTGNVGLTGSLQTVQDGDANNSPLQLSTGTVNINGTFLLNGSALTGTVSKVTGGTGVILTDGGTSVSTFPVSGTINLNPNQSFGIVSVSTGLKVPQGAITFGVAVSGTAATFTGNVSAANVYGSTDIYANGVGLGAARTSINAAITSINGIIGDGGNYATSAELAATSVALATSIGTANARITSVSNFAVALSATLATSIGTANTRITSVSNYAVALSATLATSIGTVNSRITTVSAALATSIGTANTRITSVSNYAVALSATLATSIGTVNSRITTVSAALATSIGTANTRITSVSNFAVALSATMATSIATRLPLAGGTLTGIVSGTDFYVSAVAIGVDTLLGKQLHIGTAAVADIVSLTDGATIAVNLNTGQNFAVQLGGNRALGNPTNCVPGQTGSAFIIQDGTGGRTLSYGANWEFAAGTAPTLSTAAAAVDRLDYIVYTSTGVHAIATLDVK